MKKVIAIIVAVVLVLGVGLGAYFGIPPKESKTEELNTKSGNLRVGIMSDNQLAPKGGSDTYDAYFKKGLEFFKNQNVDMLINVGDYTDTATRKAYENYKEIFESVYPEDQRPLTSFIMGNHDYWLPMFNKCWEIPTPPKMQRRFVKYTGESSPWTHKIVNGYHFIGCSPVNGDMHDAAYTKRLNWLEDQIKTAIKADPNKPVFVMTHNNPADTVYLSSTDGCKNLNELFKNYPQVVSISGHTHAPLMDERSIWQGGYTAINTQCLSYQCFENADLTQQVEGDAAFDETNPMAMIMEIKDGKVTIQRYSILDGKTQKEPWVLDTVDASKFTYTDEKRRAASAAPTWTDNTPVTASKENGSLTLKFTAASHADVVEAYQLEFVDAQGKKVTFYKDAEKKENGKDHLICISDYISGKDKMQKTVTIKLGDLAKQIPAGKYTVNVYARESFGKLSAAKTGTLQVEA